MKLVQDNEHLVITVRTDGLVRYHQGISSYNVEYTPMRFSCLWVSSWYRINIIHPPKLMANTFYCVQNIHMFNNEIVCDIYKEELIIEINMPTVPYVNILITYNWWHYFSVTLNITGENRWWNLFLQLEATNRSDDYVMLSLACNNCWKNILL